MSRLGLRLTPLGHLTAEDQDDGPDIDAAASIRLIDAFARGTGYGLVWLGAAEVGQALPSKTDRSESIVPEYGHGAG